MKLLSTPSVLAVFVMVVLTDWYYAYVVQFQPDIIINAWSVVFPFLSVFYLFFSIVAFNGLYNKKPWGLQLASFMMVLGAVFSILSYALAYKYYPIVETFVILLLIMNFITLVFMGIYYLSLKK